MIAVDTNILVYAHRREVREHPVAASKLRDLAMGEARWAMPWPCVYEFFSVVTNRRIWKGAASTPEQAWAQLKAWFGSPMLVLLAETDDFAEVLAEFLARPRVRGPVVHDARVAALCVAHGVRTLLSRDRDFALFPELSVGNPFDES
jgi:toxin-antitoxin system PIN domain toxin